jgi:hypothetical protein
MTLILSALSGGFAHQVTDRLTTTHSRSDGTVSPYDFYANKNVVFCPHNAVASIGYTGCALIEGKPTDHWIAEKLWGAEMLQTMVLAGPGGTSQTVPPPVCVLGNAPITDSLGQAVERLREACEDAFALMTAAERDTGLTIVIVGWQRTARSIVARPLLWTIERSNGGEFSTIRRRHHRDFAGLFLAAHPARPELGRGALDDLARDIALARNPEEVEGLLADTVARISAGEASDQRYIGPDSCIVRLSPQTQPQVLLTYSPAGNRVLGHLDKGGGVHPISFSPCVVTHGGYMNPSIISGSTIEYNFGEIVVRFSGDLNSPNMQLVSQKRDASAPVTTEQLAAYVSNPRAGRSFWDPDNNQWITY